MNRLYRARADRVIGGVCGGLGAYFGIDPVIVRVLFVALAIWGGFGVLIYLLLWIVIPPEERVGSRSNEVINANVSEIEQQAQGFAQEARDIFSGTHTAGPAPKERTIWAAVILIVLGAVFLLGNVLAIDAGKFVGPLLIIAIGGYLLYQASVRR